MQVDEERKGQAARTDLDIGGYEDDSEDEREIREQEEGQKDYILTLNEAGNAHVAQVGAGDSTLVVLSCNSSQTMAKILYGSDWQEIGEATTTKTSTKGEVSAADRKPKTIVRLYAFNGASPIYFALPDPETITGASVGPVVSQLFG